MKHRVHIYDLEWNEIDWLLDRFNFKFVTDIYGLKDEN